MLRSILTLLCLLVTLSLSGCAVPQQQTKDIDIAERLLHYYPKIDYLEINPSPVAGLYEVVLSGGEIIYFVPATGHMVLGAIWSNDGHNLTQERKDQRLAKQHIEFPLEKAIKIGNGPNQVVEITDPDCPFCRRSDKYFAGRTDLTRYIFLHPLTTLHPNSEAKARYILGAKDQAKAYEEVFSGKFDAQPVPAADDHGLLAIHQEVARKAEVRGTPHSWINGKHVVGFNPKEFDKLLNKK